MNDQPEFVIIRAVALGMSWTLMGVSLFVVVWWPAMSLITLINGKKFSREDSFIFATAIIGFSTFCLSALRLPFHYYFGVGDIDQINRWSRDILPFLQGIVMLQILGYAIHVQFAWNSFTRIFLVFGLISWIVCGLLVAGSMGAFNSKYVWQHTGVAEMENRQCIPIP